MGTGDHPLITFVARRVVPLAVLAACLSVLAWRAGVPLPISDTWFHLRFGMEFATSEWSVRSPGHLGPYDTADWVPTQWLAQVAMYRIEQLGGVLAVVWVFVGLGMAVVAGTYLLCRRQADALASVLATAAAWFALLPSLSARPQVLSYALALVTVLAWHRAAASGRPPWWLVPVTWLWVSLHGMWALGIVISGAAVVGIWLDRRPSLRQSVALAAVPVLSALAALLTPIGTGAYAALFSVGSRGQYFLEWNTPNLLAGTTLGVTVLLAVVVVSGLRGERASWFDTALVLLAAAFAVWSQRTVPMAAIMLAPLAARAVQNLLPAPSPVRRTEAGAVLGLVALVLAVLAVQLPGREERAVPAWVDSTLAELPPGTPVLTAWNTGAYFLWSQPRVAPVMHGYADVFTDDELERNDRLNLQRPGWRDDLADLGVDLAVIETEAPLADALVDEAGWTVVREDDDFRILAPPG